jgi:hypothetical protein
MYPTQQSTAKLSKQNDFRLAVLVTGYIRSWPLIQPFFIEHVLDQNPINSVDTIFVVPYDDRSSCQRHALQLMWEIPRSSVVTYSLKESIHTGPSGQYLAVKRAFELLQNPDEIYSLVMRMRTDFQFRVPLNVSSIVMGFGSTREAVAAFGNFLLVPCRINGWDIIGKFVLHA